MKTISPKVSVMVMLCLFFPFMQAAAEGEDIQGKEVPAGTPEENQDVQKTMSADQIKTADWIPRDYKITSSEGSEEKVLLHLEDSSGNKFSVEYFPEDKLESYHGDNFKKFLNSIQTISIYKIQSVHFLIKKNYMDAHVIPESFSCYDKEYINYLPAGIFFSQGESMTYNFRMTSDKYFMRISGIYLNDETICKKVDLAFQNPTKQVNMNDPAIVSARVEALAVEMERAELDRLRMKYAIVARLNRGFFGGSKAPDKKMIDKILHIKRNDPGITRDNLKFQLQKDGFSVSSREFELIMDVYFPDYN